MSLTLAATLLVCVLGTVMGDGYGHGGHGHSSSGIGTACIVKESSSLLFKLALSACLYMEEKGVYITR